MTSVFIQLFSCCVFNSLGLDGDFTGLSAIVLFHISRIGEHFVSASLHLIALVWWILRALGRQVVQRSLLGGLQRLNAGHSGYGMNKYSISGRSRSHVA